MAKAQSQIASLPFAAMIGSVTSVAVGERARVVIETPAALASDTI